MSAFKLQQKVRFGDVDPAGIVYFPRIYDYIHEAFEELWETHVGARYYALLLERRMGFPLVHSEVSFTAPLSSATGRSCGSPASSWARRRSGYTMSTRWTIVSAWTRG